MHFINRCLVKFHCAPMAIAYDTVSHHFSSFEVQRFYDFRVSVHAEIELMEMVIAHATFGQRDISFLKLIDEVPHHGTYVLIFLFHAFVAFPLAGRGRMFPEPEGLEQ